MVALSLSSETSGSSALMASPTLTWISITGTSLKSPMSGTLTSIAIDPSSPARRHGTGLVPSVVPQPAQTLAGFALSGSMPYCLIASATLAAGTAPSLARLSSAARVTQCRSTSKKWRSFLR